ncbi:DUF1624 domain-containing protein [Vampirovibrio sp.]|uniref:DUF1624 domain-containing protein n=1 Tax=Vampirovibrio sp. TaxID=2717857 RepID=UPI0035945F80
MQPNNRFLSIDILRGLVIAIMTVDHAREFFFKAIPIADPMDLSVVPWEVFLSRWIAHFCAPTFVFLAGVSAYLYGRKTGITKQALSFHLLKRGLILILLEVTVINFAWSFTFPPEKLYLQVIWVIGLSMICLAGLIWLPVLAMVGIALALVMAQHLLPELIFPDGSFANTLWSILYHRNWMPLTDYLQVRTSYPLLPWIGIIALGYWAGKLFTPDFSPQKRQSLLTWTGLGLIGLFVCLRATNVYGELNPFVISPQSPVQTVMSFLNLTKYPPSFLFSLMALGPALLLLRYFETSAGMVGNILLKFGRVPMFYYIIHLYVLHAACHITRFFLTIPDGVKYSVPHIGMVWLITGLTLLATYPLVIWFTEIKAKSGKKWLSYI